MQMHEVELVKMRSDICADEGSMGYNIHWLQAALASAAALQLCLCVSPATASCARQVSLLEGRMYNWDIPELRRLMKRELSCVPNMIATRGARDYQTSALGAVHARMQSRCSSRKKVKLFVTNMKNSMTTSCS